MFNQIIMIGRLVSDPELKQISEEERVTKITIAVTRPFKNVNGEYDTDLFECIVWKYIADTTNEYCHKGDLVAIKGRLQNRKHEDNKGNITNYNEIIVEKITFVSSTNKSSE